MSARDELAQTIADAADGFRNLSPGRTPTTQDLTAADAILAAGYRKPRTITAVEDLDALSVGSILRDAAGMAWHIYTDDESFRRYLGADFTQFPATVLYEPESEVTR